MDVLIQYGYRASRKEPFGVLLRRLHDGLVQADLPVSYEFAFSDHLVAGGVSAVDRAVKKFPQVAALVRQAPLPGMTGPGPKVISGADSDLPFTTLAEVTDGLPRSLPFYSVTVRFRGPAFGVGASAAATGVVAGDSWWVNGRQRSLVAGFVVDAVDSKKPAPEGALAVFLATLGKPAKTNRFPMNSAQSGEPLRVRPELAEITQKYRAKLGQLVGEAGMPHLLALRIEALTMGGSYAPIP